MSNKPSWVIVSVTTGIFLALVVTDAFYPDYIVLTDQLIQSLEFLTGGTWIGGLITAGRKQFFQYKEKCLNNAKPS